MSRIRYATDADRIRQNVVEDDNGCWIWQRRLNRGGYGIGNRYVDGAKVTFRTHRLAYEVFVGPIPAGLALDHLCRVRACCNPAHLEPVTFRENLLRSPLTLAAIRRAAQRCLNGHPFDEENTRFRPTGGRECRTCARARRQAFALRAASVPTERAA